jgi:hypothetical protein
MRFDLARPFTISRNFTACRGKARQSEDRSASAGCYAVTIFLRQIITLINFKDSLRSINTIEVIMAEIASGFSNIYFRGQNIKNNDGGISVINLNGV